MMILIKEYFFWIYEIIFYYYCIYYLRALGLEDWSIVFGNGKYFAGCAIHDRKVIQINKIWIRRGSWGEIVNIFRHEVAHALVGKDHNHDKVWRKVCIALGGSGDIYSKSHLVFRDFNWISKCLCGYKNCVFRRTKIHCPECGRGLSFNVIK